MNFENVTCVVISCLKQRKMVSRRSHKFPMTASVLVTFSSFPASPLHLQRWKTQLRSTVPISRRRKINEHHGSVYVLSFYVSLLLISVSRECFIVVSAITDEAFPVIMMLTLNSFIYMHPVMGTSCKKK